MARHNHRIMVYKFKSKASGDVIMLAAHGDQLMRLLGREPSPKGIIEIGALLQAERTLVAAVDIDNQPPRQEAGSDDDAAPTAVALRQRLWPFIDMLRRAHAEQVPIVWGV
jgi:hypothetical protein